MRWTGGRNRWNFSPEKHLTDYTIEELVWDRPDHIYQGSRHIAIDCGSVYGGQLGAICLDTGEEFYV